MLTETPSTCNLELVTCNLEFGKFLICDYHVHTPYCGHAQGKTVNYIESAIKLGMAEIGFSDHLGRYYLAKNQRKRYWDWGMRERDIARYFSELLDLREVYEDKIIVRIGLEIDYIEGAENLAEEIVARYPFDFLLGSIHCLPVLGWRHISQYVKVDPKAVYEAYFDAAKSAIRSGIFQSIAHLDFLWRYVSWPDAPQSLMEEYISDSVSLAAELGTCIEVNANGFLWSQMDDFKKYDLFDILLGLIKRHRACITIGSDAHSPELVGKAFPQIIPRIRDKGIEVFSTFDQKQRKQVKLG
jgi:histidinol-phosphatase (PHP family)